MSRTVEAILAVVIISAILFFLLYVYQTLFPPPTPIIPQPNTYELKLNENQSIIIVINNSLNNSNVITPMK